MVALKRKRPGQEYGEDEKLLHQATKALTKEAKRVRTFLLQQAIRKSKAAALKGKGAKATKSSDGEVDVGGDGDGGDSGDSARCALEQSQQGGSARSEGVGEKNATIKATKTSTDTAAAATAGGAVAAVEAVATVAAAGAGAEEIKEACSDREPAGGAGAGGGGASSSSSPASEEVLLIKDLQPSAVVKLCLRRLGLAHTGVDGEDEVKVQGGAKLQKLVSQVFEHKRVTTVMEELREKVTQRRREKLAESEGRSLPGQGRAAAGRGKGKRLAGESGGGRQGGRRKIDSGRARDAGSSGTAFVSLSGEAPSDEEWAGGTARSRNTRKNDEIASKYGPSPSPVSANKASAPGRGGGDRSARHEPGWAGAERAAGWGRGGGRANNGGSGSAGGSGGGGGGRGGRQGDNPGRQEGGRGGGGGGRGLRGGGGGARGRGGGRGGGAREGRGGGDGRNGGGSFGSGNGSGTGSGTGSASAGKREDSAGGQDLHGSWAAKRALKEKEASATKAFSGKRTTFGDDD